MSLALLIVGLALLVAGFTLGWRETNRYHLRCVGFFVLLAGAAVLVLAINLTEAP